VSADGIGRRARVIAALAGKPPDWVVRDENYRARETFAAIYGDHADRLLAAIDSGQLDPADLVADVRS
jgi:hypothetical protein